MSRATPVRFALVLAAAAALGLPAVARAADAKAELKAAVQKLADAKSYAYETTIEGGQGATSTGMVEKGGPVSMAVTMRDNTTKVVKMGDKAAVETEDGWKSVADMTDGRDRMVATMVKAYKTPTEQADQVLADAGEVKKGEGDTYTAEMPEAAAKKLLAPPRAGGRGGNGGGGGGGGGANGPQVADAKAMVTFTVADGMLSKMAVHVSGKVTMRGNEREVDRTTTTTFKDVGTAKVDVPAEAKAKLGGGEPAKADPMP